MTLAYIYAPYASAPLYGPGRVSSVYGSSPPAVLLGKGKAVAGRVLMQAMRMEMESLANRNRSTNSVVRVTMESRLMAFAKSVQVIAQARERAAAVYTTLMAEL